MTRQRTMDKLTIVLEKTKEGYEATCSGYGQFVVRAKTEEEAVTKILDQVEAFRKSHAEKHPELYEEFLKQRKAQAFRIKRTS